MNLALKNAAQLLTAIRNPDVAVMQSEESALAASFGLTVARAALALPTIDERQLLTRIRKAGDVALRFLISAHPAETLSNKARLYRTRATAVTRAGALAESKVLTDLGDFYGRAARVARNEQRRSAAPARMTFPAPAAATLS